ncbi:hypothetical protein ABAYE0088 [Acinetobacter baumannii AYE]|nr:hypothetical protein ABAYE0088 [Acinetobacter baumannii AYE]
MWQQRFDIFHFMCWQPFQHITKIMDVCFEVLIFKLFLIPQKSNLE